MKTILFFLALMFSASAGAGYLFQGQCWSDTSTALVAYRAQFPFCCSGSPPTMTVEATPTTISAGGLITEQLNTKTTTQSGWTSGVVTNVQLASCDATMVSTGNIQLMVAVLSCVFLFVLGFRVGGNMSNPKGFA